jgi:hypothetical protein
MKDVLKGLLIFVCLLSIQFSIAQSTNGGSTPSGRENWFPNQGNVGIGTRIPSEALEVIGSVKVSETLFTKDLQTIGLKATSLNILQDASIGRNLFVGGNVGIGVNNPTERLEISGNLKVTNSIFGDQLTVKNFTATETGTVNNTLSVGQKLLLNGVLGIGTNSPSEKLDVVGNIKSSADLIAINVRADKGYFKSLESDGNLTINGNIGIGVAPGDDKLTVGGNAYVNGLLTTENLIVKQKLDLKGTLSLAGVLGVGIADPQATLHVNGDGKFEGNLTANKITVNEIEIAGATGNPDGNPTSVSFGDNLFVNGSMGIGTTKIEGYRLSVDGKIRAGDDIKVYSSVEWSDFVFEKDYKLKSLSEVERYINKHGHLPELPSAKEVSKDGVDLVKMDARLLQKIEELTLYMIEMKKENDTLKKEIVDLKASKKN